VPRPSPAASRTAPPARAASARRPGRGCRERRARTHCEVECLAQLRLGVNSKRENRPRGCLWLTAISRKPLAGRPRDRGREAGRRLTGRQARIVDRGPEMAGGKRGATAQRVTNLSRLNSMQPLGPRTAPSRSPNVLAPIWAACARSIRPGSAILNPFFRQCAGAPTRSRSLPPKTAARRGRAAAAPPRAN